MAIVSISQIKHRRGTLENLPQLASGEIGWAIDARRLYIGNGLIQEGAPELGNTELLTEFSDIIAAANAYTYKGTDAGYDAVTGVDANSPITRTMQHKFDDVVNVKDFGARGDGDTSVLGMAREAAAINRALFQLYCREANSQVKRVIYFPAGVYEISAHLKFPSFATVIGDGMDCTIVRQNTAATTVGMLADRIQQTGVSQGTGSAGGETSEYIEIRDLTFEQTHDADVFQMDYGTQINFSRTKFKGPFTSSAVVLDLNTDYGSNQTSKACVRVNSDTMDGAPTNVKFSDCEFANHTYAVVGNKTINNMKFDHCYFRRLHKAFNLGEDGVTDSETLRVTVANSTFDSIYAEAIYSDKASVVSALNTFLDVGNNFQGIDAVSAIISPVVTFIREDCTSFCDYFSRNDTAAALWARVNQSTNASYSVIANKDVQHGYYHSAPGKSITLVDDTSVAATTGITFLAYDPDKSQSVPGAFIEYVIIRGSDIRTGCIVLAQDINAAVIVDNVGVESSSPGVVTFSVDRDLGVSTIKYTLSAASPSPVDATMRYNIRYFT